MFTALEIIKSSLRKLGVLSYGESLSSEEAKDALSALNAMLSDWSNSSLTVSGVEIQKFEVSSGKDIYEMGPGLDFDTAQPIEIDSVFVEYDTASTLPVKMIDNKKYGTIVDKTTTSTIPTHVYIDYADTKAVVYFYPVPSESKVINFHSRRKFSKIISLTSELSLPSGYDRAIIYNLALELAPEYGKSPSQDVYKIAGESLANIKRSNIRAIEVSCDAAVLTPGGFDWRTGE